MTNLFHSYPVSKSINSCQSHSLTPLQAEGHGICTGRFDPNHLRSVRIRMQHYTY